MSVALLMGCGSSGDVPDAAVVDAAVAPTDAGPEVAPAAGQLLIEELYYAGAVPNGGTDHYFSDQFVELVNASDVRLDLSGVLVGDAFGAAGEINPGGLPDAYRDSHPDEVVLANVWRIPDGVALAPGGHLVIAHDGTNHRPFSNVDLSGAELEAYVADSGGDRDSPTVTNLEPVHFTGGRDWLITVFGPSVVVLAAGTELTEMAGPFGALQRAPVTSVIDAIETLMDADSGGFKRLPDSVDSGHASVSGTYTGESLRRRREASGWQDTNDSGADFELSTPEPGLPPEVRPGGGEPSIELGTGVTNYEPLAEGAQLELVAGLQGGWHLDVTIRLGGFGPDGVALVYDALTTAAESISYSTHATLRVASVLADGDGWVRVGDRIVLEIDDPTDVVGTSIVVRATATLGGLSVSDERTVLVVDEDP